MAKPNQKPAQTAQQPAQTTQPAPAATQGAAPVNAANSVLYAAGKVYNVRNGTAQDNARSWEAIQAVLKTKGGSATRADLVAAVTPFNHAPFVGYLVRRGYLVPAASTPQA